MIRVFTKASVLLFLSVMYKLSNAQAPVITYQTPQSYTVNTAITPLLPGNKGGNVPAGGPGTVQNFSGSGDIGKNDGAADVASFNGAYGVAADRKGTLFVADYFNNVIRKVSANGDVITFAGSGVAGMQDGDKATAQFAYPRATAIDDAGNVYVADNFYGLVRKITPAGIVITLAGNGTKGYQDGPGVTASFNEISGLAVDTRNNIYVAETEGNRIRKIDQYGNVTTMAGNGLKGYTNGNGKNAAFNSPIALATDKSDNIYVADYFNGLIRKITPAGDVTTLAGNGTQNSVDGVGLSASFKYPVGITCDPAGNIYVGELFGGIRKIATDLTVSTVASTSECYHISIGPSGILFVGGVRRIYQVNLYGYFINKPLPQGLTFNSSSGEITGTPKETSAAADYIITAVNKDGASSTTVKIVVKDIDLPPPAEAPKISYPTPKIYILNAAIAPLQPTNSGGAVQPNGYSVDQPLPAGLNLDPNTGIISGTPTAVSPATIYTVTAVNARGPSQATINIKVASEILNIPAAPAISYDTPQKLILNAEVTLAPYNTGGSVEQYSYGLISNYAGSGKAGREDGPKANAQFDSPLKVTFDTAGNMYITDRNNYSVRKITPQGIVSTVVGPGINTFLNGLSGIVTDNQGNVYITDQVSVKKIDPSGKVITLAGGATAGYVDDTGSKARFDGLADLVIDENNNLYVADLNNSTIRKITPQGIVTTLAGNRSRGNADGMGPTAKFNSPQGLFYKGGSLYVADYVTIRKVTLAGEVTTLAGNGNSGVTNGPASSATFGNAVSIGINEFGDIYILDIGNNVLNEGNAILRRIDKNNIVSTVHIVNASGNEVYLSGPNSITFSADGLIYMPSSNNVIQSLSFDRFTIDKPLPQGLIFNKLTGVISGKPTVLSPAADYHITAYNSGGSSTTTLNLKVVISEVKQPSVITFPEPTTPLVWDKNYNYDPEVKSTQNETPVTLKSSDESIVTINNDNKLHIINIGEVTITATQEGSDNYLPAQPVARQVVVKKAAPMLTIANLADKTTCSEDFTLIATSLNSQTPVIYNSSNPLVATISPNGLVQILSAGNTTLSAYQDASALYNAAPVVEKQLVVGTGSTLPGPKVTITSPAAIYENQSVTFNASVTGEVSNYDWMVNGLSVNNNASKFTTNTLQNGDRVSCVVTFTNRCIVPSTGGPVIVAVLPTPTTISIPNTFTPNGDGINDVWRIPALVSYPNCLVSIFNRNGTQIMSSNGYNKPWDGTYNGKPLPAGVYYYVIDTRDKQPVLTGDVTIIK